MSITVPGDAMVVLVGPTGAGKSTFAARHFAPTEVISSDRMRALVADDANDQAATHAAFEILHTVLALRLAGRRLSVVDATNLERWAREQLLAAARRHGRPAIAIVLATPRQVCDERNAARSDRHVPASVVQRQHRSMREATASIHGEGFAAVHVVEDAGDGTVEVRVQRAPRRSAGRA